MKGIIITEFVELVEQKYGMDVADEMLVTSGLDMGFSAVETYDNSIIHLLVKTLGENVGLSSDELFELYGLFMFKKFLIGYSHFFEGVNDLYSFLESVEDYIHQEVLKLYPNAELPKFETALDNSGGFKMVYKSKRRMYSFAKGLILGSIEHFDPEKKLEIRMIEADGSEVEFYVF